MAIRHLSTLVCLMGTAVGAAGWLYGSNRQKSAQVDRQDHVTIAELEQKVQALTTENEKLRSLSQGGGEFAIPPDAVTRVENQTGLSFLSTPIVHRLANEELRDRVVASMEKKLGPGGLEDRNTAYQLIGWLGMEDRFGQQWAALRAVGARTWFDETSGEGWVTDRYQESNVADQASLLKLLTRILLQQHFPPSREIDDESMRTREALHSGVAAAAEAKFFQENARALGFMSLKEDTEAQQLLLSLPPFLQGLSSFVAIDGKSYADAQAVKGREELMKTLHKPPLRSGEILFPYEREIREAVATLPTTPGEAILEDSGGALGVKLWLDPLGDALQARNLAEKLCHDRWRLFATSDFDHHVIWVTEWHDETAAKAAVQAFSRMGAAHAGSEDDMSLGVAVKTPEGRILRIDQPTATSIRLINTVDPTIFSAIR